MAKGFTLIEVLVSLVILSVGLLSLMKFQTELVRSNILAKERTKAVVYAREGIESYRQFIFSGGNVDGNLAEIEDELASLSTKFTRTRELGLLANGSVKIVMTVTWPDLSESDGVVTGKTQVRLTSVVSLANVYRVNTKLKLSPSVNLSCLSGGVVDAVGSC